MRCSKCGKRIKKKSSFCIKCGAKVIPVPQKEKKNKKDKGKGKGRIKKPKAKIVIPIVLILFLALLGFLLFGGDKVPEKVRDLKGYEYLTGMVKEKLPEPPPLPDLPFDLPKKLPFDFSIKLPFDLPNPSNILGESKVPNKKKITEDLGSYEGKDGKIKFDTLEIEKRTTVEKKDTVYVATETSGDTGTSNNYYCMLYKKHFIGGWKLDSVKPYNVSGQKTSVAGVSNKTVLADKKIFMDIAPDWMQSNVKVLEHYTDLKAGTDTVVVYMELENSYVNMAGTKEVTYLYNDETKEWEAGEISKMTCLSIEPVAEQPVTAEE